MSKGRLGLIGIVAVVVVAWLAPAVMPAETIRIAYIDPLSGPFAATGENGLQQFRYAADQINKAGGVLGKRLEILGYDNKVNPQEALIQLKKVIGEGIPFVFQGNSSGVAHAISDAVLKHNERNPGSRILYLNYSAVDPALTNEKCHYWHFRFDAHADMKMAALTDVIKANPTIKKMYIIGQDYSFGKAVAEAAVKMLKEKRPDVQIVGNELHPIGKVQDFTPYVQKIIASGADAVITQLFFDNEDYYRFVEDLRKLGVKVPIIPGVLPILSASQVRRFTALCRAKIPAKLERELVNVESDDEAAVEMGIDYATRQCEALLKFGVQGLHFYSLNKSHSLLSICKNLGLCPL